MIKGIAGIMNIIKWSDESYFYVPEPVIEEVPVPKKKKSIKSEEDKTKKTAKKEYKVGGSIKLKEEPVYKTSIASTVIDTLTGRYYIYNTKILNGRIRISDKKVDGESIGWINIK